METALDRLGPHLLRLTDGETGERSQWVQTHIDSMRAHPDVELVKDGDYSDLAHVTKFALRDGHEFDADLLDLGYHRFAEASYPRFRVLRERFGRPDLSFQVGLPSPVDLVASTFGLEEVWGSSGLVDGYTEATLRELNLIRDRLPADEVVFQIETVSSMVSVALAPPQAQPELAKHNAGRLVEVPKRAPAGTRFGYHLCLADFHHKAMAEMGSARALVLVVNALAEIWPSSADLEYVHAPFAAADKPGSFDEAWYEPLAELSLPSEVRFVAGFVHESLDTRALRRQLNLIEKHTRRKADIATTCGLGRRPSIDQVWDAMDKTVELIDA
jgi:hypothetical protein